jgi:hypothetical protein
MHAAPRRPLFSWPAALLPAALVVALLGAGAATSAGHSAVGASSGQPPITDLQVVSSPR